MKRSRQALLDSFERAGIGIPFMGDPTVKQSLSVATRLPPTPVRLTAAERLELEQGAGALGETISATLRVGGLARARRAIKRERLPKLSIKIEGP